MPLSTVNMVPRGHLISTDIKQYADLLLGTMTDQPVTLGNNLSVGGAITGNGSVPTGGSAGQVLSKSSATDYALAWTTPAAGLTLPLGQNLTFSPDNSYDIGTSTSADRPRTIYVGTSLVFGADVFLQRGLANVLEQRNGASSQSFRLYVGYVDTNNYERLRFTAATTGNTIVSEALGSGTVRDLTIGTTGVAGNLRFQTLSSVRWLVNTTGHFVANVDAAYDIGASGANRPRNLYLYSYQEGLQVTKPTNPPTNNRRLYAKTDGWYDLDSAGVETKLGAGGGALTWPLQAPDGSAAAPSYGFASSQAGIYSNGLAVMIASSGSPRMAVGGTISLYGSLLWGTDNVNDIGQSLSARPRNVYAGTSFIVGTSTLATGNLSSSGGQTVQGSTVTLTAGAGSWMVNNSSHLIVLTDNAFDIGASGANRPRNLYLGSALSAPSWTSPGSMLIQSSSNLLQQANGINPQSFYVYNTFTDGSNYERLELTWVGGNAGQIQTTKAGTGVARPLYLVGAENLYLGNGGAVKWAVAGGGDFLALADNAYDIGANGSSRPRNVYVAGYVETPRVGSVSGVFDLMSSGGSRWRIDAAGHLIAIGGDNTFDIGAPGAYRPRNLYLGGGVDVAGGVTLHAQLDAPLLSPTGNLIEQRNAANAQSWYLYNTYTDASNYERFVIKWGANQVSIQNEAAGTGSIRPIIFNGGSATVNFNTSQVFAWQTNSATKWAIVTAEGGHWRPGPDNTLDLGLAANRIRSLYIGTSLIYSAGARITGDFSNATVSSRVALQTSTVNSSTSVSVIPNGSGTTSLVNLFANSAPDNSSYVGMGITATQAQINSAHTGTGGDLPLVFMTAATERMRFSATTGQINIGAAGTPPFLIPRGTASLSVEAPGQYAMLSSLNGAHLSGNAYWDGTNWQRYNVGSPSCVAIAGGTFTLMMAAAAANPIGWVTRMTVDAAGNADITGNFYCSYPGGVWSRNSGGTLYRMISWTGDNMTAINNGSGGSTIFANSANTVRIASLNDSGNLACNGTITGAGLFSSTAAVYIPDGNRYIVCDANAMYFRAPVQMSCQTTGGVPCPITASAFTVVASSARFKENIRTVDDALDIVRDPSLHGTHYRYLEKDRYGFVSEPWHERAPEVVSLDDEGLPLGMDYQQVGAITFEALKQYIEQTDRRLAALEGRQA